MGSIPSSCVDHRAVPTLLAHQRCPSHHLYRMGPHVVDFYRDAADILGITRPEAKRQLWPLLYGRPASSLTTPTKPSPKTCSVCQQSVYPQLPTRALYQEQPPGWGAEWDSGQHNGLAGCIAALGEVINLHFALLHE